MLVLALLVSACTVDGGSGPTPTSADDAFALEPPIATGEEVVGGGTLRFGLGRDPASIDPGFVSDDAGSVVVDALFDSLVRLDARLRIVPAAAQTWTVSDDATVFEFSLRPDATFHDGSPVRATDFVRAFDRITDGTASPRSVLAYKLAPVRGFDAAQSTGASLSGVEAVGDFTLRITLSSPFAEFLEVLADPALAPVPAVADDDPEAFAAAPVGNGPFQLSGEVAPGEFVRVRRFDDYRGRRPALDEVVFQIYTDDPDGASQYAAFEDGRLHVADVPTSELDEAMSRYGASLDGYLGPGVLDGATTSVYFYGFDTSRPPFDDPAVRRAVSLLIDREAIVDEVTDETREVATSLVPPSLPDHQPDACAYCAFDPERAAELFAQRGRPAAPSPSPSPAEGGTDPDGGGTEPSGDGTETGADEEPTREPVADPTAPVSPTPTPIDDPITIVHNEGRTHAAIANRVATQIRRHLRIPVRVEARPLPEFLERLRAGEVGIFRFGWEADYPSAGSFLHPLFTSPRDPEDPGDNYTRFVSEELDALLAEARATTSSLERTRRYREAERFVLDEAVVAPIYVYRHHRVVAEDVRGLRVGPLGDVDLTEVSLDPSG